ncbi:MAG: efflux RND transporter periplasmic adaptor subunit [Deltaproteobacteria bacterium]|nr:efflux RND transporter periplasmic adaptor subunit [Deltaproteobacteria bacterium]
MRHITALLAATALATACHPAPKAQLPQQESPLLGVKTVKPRSGEQALPRITGELRARREAMLAAELAGRVAWIKADVGDRVKKGEVLVQLDPTSATLQAAQARAAKAMAEANLQAARNELARTEALAKAEAAPAAALERAHTAVAQASAAVAQSQAAVASAEEYVSKTSVRAPFDGTVTMRLKNPGEMVSAMPPAPILALVDLGSVEVRAAVPETVVDLVRPGAELACTLSPSGKPFRAKIRVVGSTVEASNRTVEIRADPTGADLPELRPGSLVEVDIGSEAAGLASLFLPAETIRVEGPDSFVWVVEGEQLRRRPVQIEKSGPGTVRVLSGLGPGVAVVSQAGSGLMEGARVRVAQ